MILDAIRIWLQIGWHHVDSINEKGYSGMRTAFLWQLILWFMPFPARRVYIHIEGVGLDIDCVKIVWKVRVNDYNAKLIFNEATYDD